MKKLIMTFVLLLVITLSCLCSAFTYRLLNTTGLLAEEVSLVISYFVFIWSVIVFVSKTVIYYSGIIKKDRNV